MGVSRTGAALGDASNIVYQRNALVHPFDQIVRSVWPDTPEHHVGERLLEHVDSTE